MSVAALLTSAPVEMHPDDTKVMSWDFLKELDDGADLLATIVSIDDESPGDASALTVSDAAIATNAAYRGRPRTLIPAYKMIDLTLSGAALVEETRYVAVKLTTTGGRTLEHRLPVIITADVIAGPIYKSPGDVRSPCWDFTRELDENGDAIDGFSSLLDETIGEAGTLAIGTPQVLAVDTAIGTPARIVPANKGVKFSVSGGVADDDRVLVAKFTTTRGSSLTRKLAVNVRTT